MQRHDTTFLGPQEIGHVAMAYRPTFDFEGEFIDSTHARIGNLPLLDHLLIQLPNGNSGSPVPGWLQRADALKLYEMACFCEGDILELGCCQGLSTIIMASAIRGTQRNIRIETVDHEPACVAATVANLEQNGLAEYVTATCEDAVAAVLRFGGAPKQFGFVFVDHSHAYEPVRGVCAELRRILKPGSFVLFHDFNDLRNQDASNADFGVYQAVLDALPQAFQFYGIYGCAGLYRYMV